jgi:hypothetical protein
LRARSPPRTKPRRNWRSVQSCDTEVTSRQYRLGFGPRQSTRERFRASGRRSRAPSTSRTIKASCSRPPSRERASTWPIEVSFSSPLRRTSPDPVFSFWRRT